MSNRIYPTILYFRLPPVSDYLLSYIIAYPEEKGLPLEELIRRRKAEVEKSNGPRRVWKGLLQETNGITHPGRIYSKELYEGQSEQHHSA